MSKTGVETVLITPEINNKSFLKPYILWESLRSGFDVYLFQGRMSHLKAILIDDHTLILGSPNFDFMSFAFQQEVFLIIRDPDVIAQFNRKVLEPDMANTTKYDGNPSGLKGLLTRQFMRILGGFFALLNKWI